VDRGRYLARVVSLSFWRGSQHFVAIVEVFAIWNGMMLWTIGFTGSKLTSELSIGHLEIRFESEQETVRCPLRNGCYLIEVPRFHDALNDDLEAHIIFSICSQIEDSQSLTTPDIASALKRVEPFSEFIALEGGIHVFAVSCRISGDLPTGST
jgi:hypothetical protein